MANFGLKLTFINSNKKCCGQTDLSSKIATKVYTARYIQAKKKDLNDKFFNSKRIWSFKQNLKVAA